MLNVLKCSSQISLIGHLSSNLKLFVSSPRAIGRKQLKDQFHMFSTNKVITLKEVKEFAFLTNDLNPIHLEHGHQNQPPIVHGALLMSLVAGVIGSDYPGPGTIVLSQEMSFLTACPVGTNVTIEIKMEDEHPSTKLRKITYCNFSCCDTDDKSICFMKGKAKLKIKS